jgi:diamine N-acetyltransferase
VAVRPLTRADLAQMAAWRPFDNLLYSDANWVQRSPYALRHWYTHCSQDRRRLLYTIADEAGQVIGSITLREIDGRRSARLGITLGADFVNQGYGTEALALFLDHFFESLGFQRMVLDVVGYNRRAIRVYEKLGFKKVGQRRRPVKRRKALKLLKEPRYTSARRFVRRDWLRRYWLSCYEMALSKTDWQKKRQERQNGMFAETAMPEGASLPQTGQDETSEAAAEKTPGESRETRWEVVAVANGVTAAAIIRGHLESEGIPTRMQHEPAGVAIGLIFGKLGEAKVLVPEPLAERALEILNQPNPLSADDAEDVASSP